LPDTLPKFDYQNRNNLAERYIPKSKRQHHEFDINLADTNVWEDFPGIGTGMSHRIIEYRNRLGGFVSIDQVKEVYGMDSSVLCELKPYMRVSTNNLSCININKTSIDDLAKHPYIKYKEAKAIVLYRMQHGDYDQVSSLRFVKSLPWEWIERVSPYLCTK
jgi:DNA uptake protein ComE-like DNA-binding protein